MLEIPTLLFSYTTVRHVENHWIYSFDSLLGINDFGELILFFSFLVMLPLGIYLAALFRMSKVKVFFSLISAVYFSYVFGHIFLLFFDGYDELISILRSWKLERQLKYFFHPYGGGTVLFGSLIGTLIGASLLYPLFRKSKASYFRSFDIVIICFSFVAIFARLAAFGNGTAFGFPFDSPFSLVFTPGSAAVRQLVQKGIIEAGMSTPPLFPTQPIMILAKTVIFFTLLLKSFTDKKKVPLNYVALFFLIYGPYRFCIDFFKFERAGYFAGLTSSQWCSIIFFILSVLYYRFLYKKFEAKYCSGETRK